MTSPATPTGVTAVVERLLFALVNAQLHGPVHPRVREACADVATRVAEHCAPHGTRAVLLGVAGDQIVVDGRPVLGASLFAKRLLQRIESRGAGGVELDASVTADDVVGLVDVLARRVSTPDLVAAAHELAQRGVHGVKLVPPYAGGADAEASPGAGGAAGDGAAGDDAAVGPGTEGERAVVALHQSTVDLLQGLTIAACQGRELDIAPVSAIVDRMVASLERDAGFLHALAHYPEYDFFTFGHSIRVGLIAIDVVRRSTDDPDLVHRVGCAGLLHDVGKSLVRWDVLHKRGPLDADEKREMQRHSVLGAGILLANKTSDPLAVAAAYGHHCDMCGGGYPRTCGEYEQGLVTRLVKICDVYEALTAVRPYKPSMTPARAFRTMLGMKGHFDEELLAHFIRSVGVYPAGTRVRLDDGSVGRVVRQTEDLRRPVVDVLEVDGGPVAGDDRRRVDLSVAPVDGPSTVVRALDLAPVGTVAPAGA
ncbi:MAG: HD domain-containing protein [Planctomycetota bacterium]